VEPEHHLAGGIGNLHSQIWSLPRFDAAITNDLTGGLDGLLSSLVEPWKLGSLLIGVGGTVVDMKEIARHGDSSAFRREHTVSQSPMPGSSMPVIGINGLEAVLFRSALG
jgi:hypothetical protein